MWSLGRGRLMIQEASEDVTEGGILFPSLKTSNIEENRHFSTEFTLKCLGASKKRLGA